MKKIISILCAMLCAVLLAACSGDSNNPEGVAEKYTSYILKEQYGKIVDITHFKKELTKEDKNEYAQLIREKCMKSFEKQGGLQSVEITGTDMAEDGTTAHVHIMQHFGDGSEKEGEIKTILVDDKWMIDSGK